MSRSDVLAGKVVMVMGGTSGLGLSAVRALINASALVVAVGPAEADWTEAAAAIGDENGLSWKGDARDPGTADRAVDAAYDRLGRLDGLFHVAGGSGRSLGDGPLHELTDEGLRATVEWNLHSTVYSNRAVARAWMKYRSGGSILNVGSVLATHPAPHHFATHAYAAAKAALEGLTRSAASYYAPHGIRFNLIAPGLIATPMSQRAQRDERVQRFVRSKQPLDGGRSGQPSDIDAAVVYFLSDQSRFVTGQVLWIDGGWSVTDGQLD